MKTVLIFTNTESSIYNFRRELVQRLIAEKNKVVIALTVEDKSNYLIKLGCDVVNIKVERHGTNPATDFVLLINYIKLIKRIQPDIVLTYTIKPNIYGSIASRFCRTPHINNVTGLGTAFHKKGGLRYLLLWMQKMAYKKSSCVFFQNSVNMKFFKQKRIVNQKNRLLPGSGVNLTIHKFEKYPELISPVRFITIARIRKDKGFHELFSAIKEIHQKNNNVEFHVIGSPEDKSCEKTIINMNAKNEIIYHGFKMQEEVHDLIASCHCTILPSYHEGMANVLLESAAAGRPCLASNIPGCRDAIIDEITGYLFHVKDANSLTRAIQRFIELPHPEKEKMGIAGRKKMEEEFDRNLVINAYLEEIKKTLQ